MKESDFSTQNITDQQKAIEKTNTGNKNTIGYDLVQGQMLKKFKDNEGFLENVEL